SRATVERIRSGRRFRQRICSDPLTRSQLRKIFLLLLGSTEIDDRQCANSDMSSPSDTKTSRFGNVVGDDRRGDLVHLHSALLFGNVDRRQAELTGFLDEIAAH